MGVPGLFGWVSRKFPKCVEKPRWDTRSHETAGGESKSPEGAAEGVGDGAGGAISQEVADGCDNLYLDLNGVIHPAVHKSVKDGRLDFEAFVLSFFEEIKETVRRVRPEQLLYLAVDGVAPRAKMAQQRKRRFTKGVDAEEAGRQGLKIRKRLKQKGYAVPSVDDILRVFDTNCISPGTDFMNKMAKRLHSLAAKAIHEDCDGIWGKLAVIVSDGSVPGEGEHKALTFIRAQRTQTGYNPNTRHTIEGLDADLMLLALATHEAHVSIVRPAHTDYKAHDPVIVRVNTIRRYLELEFGQLAASLPFPFDIERIIDDFVLCCSLVGNDFLPHLPSIRIYDGALDLIFECYKLILPECSGYLTKDCKVNLKNGGLARLMRRIGNLENKIFEANEKKRPRRYAPENSPWQERPVGKSQRRDAQVEAFLRDSGAVAIRFPKKQLSKQDEARLMVGVCLPDLQCWVDNDGDGHFTLIKPGVAQRLLDGRSGDITALACASEEGGDMAGVDIMEELRTMLESGEISQSDFDEAAAENQAETQTNLSTKGEVFRLSSSDTTQAIVQRVASKFFKNEVLAAIEQATGLMRKKLAKNDSSSLRLQNPHHRLEYYRRFFDECLPEKRLPKGTSPEKIAGRVANEYVRGMCWALEYYLHDCPSWGWLFPFHFAPLAQDMAAALTKQGNSEEFATFDGSVGPTSSISQLLCVLPRSSAPAVPNAKAQMLMCDPASPLAASFEAKMTYDTRGESRKWKWTAVFPFASPDQVTKVIADKGVQELPHGVERIYMRRDHPIAVAVRKEGGNATASHARPVGRNNAARMLSLIAGVLSSDTDVDGHCGSGGGGATAAGVAATIEEFIYTPHRVDIHSREHGNTLRGVRPCPIASTLRADDVKSGKVKAKRLLGIGSSSSRGVGQSGRNRQGTSGVCRNWQETGSCSYGNRCRFTHPASIGGGGARLCKYFKQTGTCRFGASCRYAHDDGGGSGGGKKQDMGANRQICFQFQRDGTCGYGERCRYSHDTQ